MVIIRGATTIGRDDKEEIRGAVKELLEQITSVNLLKKDEIVSIVFSSTSDIHSYYPAKAAREAGFAGCSLFSAQEPEIDGSMPLCIRVMLFVEKEIKVRHVYLRGAKVLRRDIASSYNIAIDGPAGSGKSTVAKRIAADYHILHLDTGAMYRAFAVRALEEGIDIENEAAVVDLMGKVKLDVTYEEEKQHTLIDGVDMTDKLRTPEVSMAASTVSKHPSMRVRMAEKQREIAGQMSCILDGRDIGTFVLPDADFKFFLTADPAIRAKRRYDEMTEKGLKVDFGQLMADLTKRDQQDSTRAVAPLRQAEDAILVDTSSMTVDEVVAFIEKKIQEKI